MSGSAAVLTKAEAHWLVACLGSVEQSGVDWNQGPGKGRVRLAL